MIWFPPSLAEVESAIARALTHEWLAWWCGGGYIHEHLGNHRVSISLFNKKQCKLVYSLLYWYVPNPTIICYRIIIIYDTN